VIDAKIEFKEHQKAFLFSAESLPSLKASQGDFAGDKLRRQIEDLKHIPPDKKMRYSIISYF